MEITLLCRLGRLDVQNAALDAVLNHGVVYLGGCAVEGIVQQLTGMCLLVVATVTADGRGDISGRDMVIPPVSPGDYTLSFVGAGSPTPVSVGFNVQGFHPWTVLENYYVAPHTGVGLEGTDFVPGEVVQVFLNTRLSQPVAQITADGDGRFRTTNAFTLPDLSGNNELIFVGDQSQTEVTATFAAATPTPPPGNP